MKRWFVPGFLAVLALALALRLPELRLRPMHNDEAVNAIKFRALWNENNYKYDPNEYHGPTLPYFTLPSAWLNHSHDFNDFTEATFRVVTAVFGAALIVLLLLLTPDFGRAETLWASLFAALSPAMVFYSRYYIHEMLLVFFTALAATAWWRHGKSGRFGWCVLAGVGLGLMWATKETFVFAVLSLALAAACASGWSRWRGDPGFGGKTGWSLKSMAVALGIAVVVAMLFFSSWLTNSAGVADAVKTYAPWLHRGEGMSPHAHSWSFYFERLLFYHAKGGPIWSEGLIAGLALVGFVAALAEQGLADCSKTSYSGGRRREESQICSETTDKLETPHVVSYFLNGPPGTANVMLVRVIAFYTAWMTLFYTVLPYKTPWCLLGFWHGMILLAGVGAAVLVRLCKPLLVKGGMVVLLTAATAQLGWQAWKGSFAVDQGGVPYCDSAKNPYTYSQTTPDVFRLVQTVDALARVSPAGYGTVIEVMSPDSYWPLPWYLRRFKATAIGFWDKIPAQPLAPIMIVSAGLHAGFDERPEKTHLMAGYFELRPNVFFELYVNVDLWAQYIKTLPKEKD